MSFVLGLLKGLLNPKVLLALAIAGALWWVHGYIYNKGYSAAEAVLTPKIDALTGERDRANALAKAADKRYREQEATWQSLLKEKQDEYNTGQIENAKFLARALATADKYRIDSQQLRDRLSTYAAGSGQATPDTVASASDRAIALGKLLAEALAITDATMSVAAENTNAAEGNGNAVRALLASWPK